MTQNTAARSIVYTSNSGTEEVISSRKLKISSFLNAAHNLWH
jgi:hypothetical protein